MSTLLPHAPSADLPGSATYERLPRRLGGWSATAVVVGVMIGSGIFRVPSSVAAQAGSVPAILGLWVFGGVVSLFGALCYAELAALFPRAGGEYVFLREAYGRLVAFVFGWTFLLVNPASWAAIALIFASYLGTFVPLTEGQSRAVAVALILLLSAAHYRSVRLGAWIQTSSTAAKVMALVLLAAVVFLFGQPGAGAFSASSPVIGGGWGSLGIAFIGVLFAYDGWQTLAGLAGEVRDPGRNLPRALAAGTALVVLMYLLVNTAYLYALPLNEVAASSFVAVDAVSRAVGGAAGALIAALVMLSTFGALNGLLMANPRVFYAMAEDGLFFRSLAAVHPRFMTPHRAVLFSAALAVLYVTIRSFEELAEAFVVGSLPFIILSVGAVLVLRRTMPDLPRPYRTWGYPWVPAAYLTASAGLILNALVEHPLTTLLSFGITLLGVPLFFAWRAAQRRSSSGASTS